MRQKVLIVFAHPYLEKSRVHKRLLKAVAPLQGVTFHDLYDQYPAFDVDIRREQDLLLGHDIVVWQFPLYWYSCPPLLKQWIDLVLEHGWAYGKKGKALLGKQLLCAITSGGIREAYQQEGYNKYTIAELLRPLERTAVLCNMDFLPPFMIHGTHRATPAELDSIALDYTRLLQALQRERVDGDSLNGFQYLNEWLIEHVVDRSN